MKWRICPSLNLNTKNLQNFIRFALNPGCSKDKGNGIPLHHVIFSVSYYKYTTYKQNKSAINIRKIFDFLIRRQAQPKRTGNV